MTWVVRFCGRCLYPLSCLASCPLVRFHDELPGLSVFLSSRQFFSLGASEKPFVLAPPPPPPVPLPFPLKGVTLLCVFSLGTEMLLLVLFHLAYQEILRGKCGRCWHTCAFTVVWGANMDPSGSCLADNRSPTCTALMYRDALAQKGVATQ